MFNSLNIDLYKEGFDINVMDCIDIPIAATAGYYQFENYFYYSFLFSVKSNWGNDIFDKSGNLKLDYFNIRNNILKELGLMINIHHAENKHEMLEIAKRCILDDIPVMLITKYKSIFYNRYYMQENGNRAHALVIDEWNSDTSIFRIKDSAFMRGIEIGDSNADILFPLRLSDEMVSTIWETSNNEFKEQGHIFSNSIYSMQKKSNGYSNSYDKLMESFLSDYDFENSVLVSIISSFNNKLEYIRLNIVALRRFLYGCLYALFNGIERWLTRENSVPADFTRYYDFKDEYLKFRTITISKLHKYADTNRQLKEEEILTLVKNVREYDKELRVLVSDLNNQYKTYKSHIQNKKNITISLENYCNNEGFAMSQTAENTADLTGNGIFFIASNLPSDGIFNENNTQMKMVVKKSDGQMDNISCEGQEIDIKEGLYSKIAFLGCSEYGSYCEKINLCMGSDVIEEVEIRMSDFYEAPLYGEKTIWSGKAAQKSEGKINTLNFNGRMFLSETGITSNKINKIILPNRKNIHLFAITLIE